MMDRGEIPVLVYQMGKVGSTSITDAIIRCGKPAVQVHELRPEHVASHLNRYNSVGHTPPKHLRDSDTILQAGWLTSGRQVKIVTPVRPLFERNLSAFIQQLPHLISSDERYVDALDVPSWMTMTKHLPWLPWEWRMEFIRRMTVRHLSKRHEELITLFSQHYPHHIAMNWFEDQFRASLGIDVYEMDYSVEDGYLLLSKDAVKVLVIDSRLPNKQMSDIIGRFLALPSLDIMSKHVSTERTYAPISNMMRQDHTMMTPIRDQLLTCQFSKHFYPM